ncbi:hypothetical protein [Phenylobacterium sp.]|uniref:hypothetical protein n=1 Tax=Phenylobacterium sp. TaxID=1871053 RepID=UPI0025DD5B2F|nr:hypothetical protein [Phenylobacterium sp.]
MSATLMICEAMLEASDGASCAESSEARVFETNCVALGPPASWLAVWVVEVEDVLAELAPGKSCPAEAD